MTGVSKTRFFFRRCIVNSAKRQNFLKKICSQAGCNATAGELNGCKSTLPACPGWDGSGQLRHWPTVLQDRPSGIFEYTDNGPLSLSACNVRVRCVHLAAWDPLSLRSASPPRRWVSKIFFFCDVSCYANAENWRSVFIIPPNQHFNLSSTIPAMPYL